MNELKYCKFCDKEKPVKDFVKSGFAIKNICRECQNQKQTKIYKNNKKVEQLQQENQQLKDKLSKIETLIINHNCDTGDIYYKYNSKFLKSELKQRILEILYGESSDSNVKD